jgi:hypothetical protein
VDFDTYIYNAGYSTDQIEDSNAQGQIIFQGTACWAERERSSANVAVIIGQGRGYRFGIYAHSTNRLNNILDRSQTVLYIRATLGGTRIEIHVFPARAPSNLRRASPLVCHTRSRLT